MRGSAYIRKEVLSDKPLIQDRMYMSRHVSCQEMNEDLYGIVSEHA